jgi:hypothetical protein
MDVKLKNKKIQAFISVTFHAAYSLLIAAAHE